MEIKVEYWDKINRVVKKPSGYSFYDTNSELKKTESITGNTKEEIYAEFYSRNNSLRYCNGAYWKFVDKSVDEDYRKNFLPKHHTIENYYGRGGIVD